MSTLCFSPSSGSVVKRSVDKLIFRPEDIYLPSTPRRVNGGIEVEFVVLVNNGTSQGVVPGGTVLSLIEKNTGELDNKLGGKLMKATLKEQPEKPTSLPQEEGLNEGMIAGIIIAVIIVIVAAIAVWYYRYGSFFLCLPFSLSIYFFVFVFCFGMLDLCNIGRCYT